MTKEQLLEEANRGRRASVILANAIFDYIGGGKDLQFLQELVESLFTPEFVETLKHKYILKDFVENQFDLESAECEPDTTETMEIKEDK